MLISVRNYSYHSVCVILHISHRIYCHADHFIISPFIATGRLNYLLQRILLFSVIYANKECPSCASTRSTQRGTISGDLAGQGYGPKWVPDPTGLWTQMGTRQDAVVFGSENEIDTILYTILKNRHIETNVMAGN